MSKSLIELAYDYIAKQGSSVKFKKLWSYIKKEAKLTDEQAADRAGQFYTSLLLDGRFVTLGNNEWDLRSNHTFDKVHIDMKDIYSDVETSDDDSEEENEEKEYNQCFEEKTDSKEELSEENEESSETNEENREF